MAASIEVIIWDPAGFGSSSFGHVSVVISDGSRRISYSLSPSGCDVRPFQGPYKDPSYVLLNGFRNGYGLELNLTPTQTAAVVRHFELDFSCSYSLVGVRPDGVNNCATPIQRALQAAGVSTNGFSLMPRALGLNLWNSGLVKSARRYEGWNVKERTVVPPWSPSSFSYPWAR